MVEEVKEVKKVKVSDKYVLKEVIVQKDIGIGLADDEEVFTDKGLLLEILNKLDRIERAIA
jgi:hypothetical protein